MCVNEAGLVACGKHSGKFSIALSQGGHQGDEYGFFFFFFSLLCGYAGAWPHGCEGILQQSHPYCPVLVYTTYLTGKKKLQATAGQPISPNR